jgi:hypothetical protein
MSECAAYIPDMSGQDSKRARHRQRQARYEARRRAGLAGNVNPTPLGAAAIDALGSLGSLREGTETDRYRVGDAVATTHCCGARSTLRRQNGQQLRIN